MHRRKEGESLKGVWGRAAGVFSHLPLTPLFKELTSEKGEFLSLDVSKSPSSRQLTFGSDPRSLTQRPCGPVLQSLSVHPSHDHVSTLMGRGHSVALGTGEKDGQQIVPGLRHLSEEPGSRD